MYKRCKDDELPLVRGGTKVVDAILVMSRTPGRPGAALVVDENEHLLGIFTDGDLRRMAQTGDLHMDEAVDDHMGADPQRIDDSMLVGEALHRFRQSHVDQMPVVAAGGARVVGLVDVQDLLEVRL